MATYSFVNPGLRVKPQEGYSENISDMLSAGFCDYTGCGHYRIIFPFQAISQRFRQMRLDAHFGFRLPDPGTRCYWLQRWFGRELREFFRQTALPHFRRYGIRYVYDIDDVLIMEDMPEYNCLRQFFRDTADFLPFFLENADRVTVSVAPLRDYYVRKFGLPESKFKVLPNYIPRYWIDRYDPVIVRDRLTRHRGGRPRVGILGGATHFAVAGDVPDDCSGIYDWIVENRKKYRFVFPNNLSRALMKYADDFEIFESVQFLDYPRKLAALDLDLILNPLADSDFNRCKSTIKLLEPWGIGVPVLVQNLPNYFADGPECCFRDAEELERKANAILGDESRYLAECERNHADLKSHFTEEHVVEIMDALLK